MNDSWTVERAAARYASGLALGVMAVALGWFAYVDAPISDRVMLWIACAVGAGSVAALAGLWVQALTLRTPVAETAGAQRRMQRLLRLSLLALAALVVLMAMAMVVTLNLRGTGSGADVEDAAVTI